MRSAVLERGRSPINCTTQEIGALLGIRCEREKHCVSMYFGMTPNESPDFYTRQKTARPVSPGWMVTVQ